MSLWGRPLRSEPRPSSRITFCPLLKRASRSNHSRRTSSATSGKSRRRARAASTSRAYFSSGNLSSNGILVIVFLLPLDWRFYTIALRQPVEHFVIHSRKRQEPRPAGVTRNRRKRQAVKWIRFGVAVHHFGHACTKQRGHRHAVPGVPQRKIHTAHLARVRHQIHRKAERAAPHVLHLHPRQLRIHRHHAAPQNLRALAIGVRRGRNKARAPAEHHAPVWREAEVIQKVL